ncbi:hypothetical protein [Aurantiacibacter hainanensis]|uniref:hypothetical protein n=1 Tax=Aurantiacibacter hainanensis TaxID=3076114 RepID=UPI0030C71185
MSLKISDPAGNKFMPAFAKSFFDPQGHSPYFLVACHHPASVHPMKAPASMNKASSAPKTMRPWDVRALSAFQLLPVARDRFLGVESGMKQFLSDRTAFQVLNP